MGYIEAEDFERLDIIRNKEGMERSEVIRIAISEYIKNHYLDADTFKLDDWQDNIDFIAIPPLMSQRKDLDSYVENEKDIDELRRVKEQIGYFLTKISSRLNSLDQNIQQKERARYKAISNDRFRINNDIRYKDPRKMKSWELVIYNRLIKEHPEIEIKKEVLANKNGISLPILGNKTK